ncbi:sugar transferase [Acuticoccus sediminis]|nr:sugar transferase [Acuticoccus sediminis]
MRGHRHEFRGADAPADVLSMGGSTAVAASASPQFQPVPALPREADHQDTIPSGELLFRIRDLVLATVLVVALAPLFALIALAIKLDSSGPVFFRQQRGGLGGKAFTCLKFRSMHVLEDGPEVRCAERKDKRVTRIGHFLRRSSLDELPQLFNVLHGDMSLVGPRPHALAHDREYARTIPSYTERFRVKPGMTGLAQILDLRGEVNDDIKITGRVAADVHYVERRSLMLDFVIMAMTPIMLVFCRSAY